MSLTALSAQFGPALPTLPHWLALGLLFVVVLLQGLFLRDQMRAMREEQHELRNAFEELREEFHRLDKRMTAITGDANGGWKR